MILHKERRIYVLIIFFNKLKKDFVCFVKDEKILFLLSLYIMIERERRWRRKVEDDEWKTVGYVNTMCPMHGGCLYSCNNNI